jgi:hypothetical protein
MIDPFTRYLRKDGMIEINVKRYIQSVSRQKKFFWI